MLGRRVWVMGTSGSGKTTLARRLAARLDYPHIELDALYLLSGWQTNPNFVEDATLHLTAACWVADGNYRMLGEVMLARADTLVWIDLPGWRTYGRLLRRTFIRGISRTELWNGNRESLFRSFLTRESLIWYVLKTSRRRRERFEGLMSDPSLSGKSRVRLQSPAEVERFIATATARPRAD
ncbi:MAG: adenylate kinase [Fimbriimonadaceae bacterium]